MSPNPSQDEFAQLAALEDAWAEQRAAFAAVADRIREIPAEQIVIEHEDYDAIEAASQTSTQTPAAPAAGVRC